MLEVGRICIKTAGREAGCYCCIIKKIDNDFVLITGPKEITKVRRRRCNISHLEPLVDKISIKPDATDNEVLREYEKTGFFQKYKLKKITQQDIVEIKKQKAEKAAKPEKKEKTEEKEKITREALKIEEKKEEKPKEHKHKKPEHKPKEKQKEEKTKKKHFKKKQTKPKKKPKKEHKPKHKEKHKPKPKKKPAKKK